MSVSVSENDKESVWSSRSMGGNGPGVIDARSSRSPSSDGSPNGAVVSHPLSPVNSSRSGSADATVVSQSRKRATESEAAPNGSLAEKPDDYVTPQKIAKITRVQIQTPEEIVREQQKTAEERYGPDNEVSSAEADVIARESFSTPRPSLNLAKDRKKYRASMRVMGLEADTEHEEQDEEQLRQLKELRSRGSPGPNGKPAESASSSGERVGMIDADGFRIPDEPEPEPPSGPDEYAPWNEVLGDAEQVFGITMPAPVATYRQRQEAVKQENRFMVTNLILEDFKSYAGRVAIGPFHRNFTCIIGPNGSGKSNTIDALLFVFGYKPKRLRTSKISDLIHTSVTFPNCKMCRVTVHFARVTFNPNDPYSQNIVPGTDYSISREAHKPDRKGSSDRSAYFINGRPVDRKDVQVRLRRDGIDIDQNRFLILQGEVEAISLMKPKRKSDKDDAEMLEYIEEIVGTNQYIKPIEEMDGKVKTLLEKEEKKNSEVFQFGKTLNSLEKIKQETEEFLLLENEIFFRDHLMLQIKRSNVNIEKKDTLEELENCSKQLKVVEDSLALVTHELRGLTDEYGTLTKMIEDLEKSPSVTGEDVKKNEKRKEKLTTKQLALQEALVRLDKERGKFVTELEKLEGAPDRLTAEIERIDVQIQDAKEMEEAARQEHQEALARLPEKLQALNERQRELNDRLAGICPDLTEKQRKLDNKKLERDGFTAEFDRAVARRGELETEVEQLEIGNVEKSGEIKKIKEELPRLRQDLAQKVAGVDERRRSLARIDQKIREKREMIDEAEARSEIATGDAVFNRLLEDQQKGLLSGIIGKLGELATVDEKYDIAISTNYGGALNKIVVDTQEHSKQVIEHLKQHNLGRAELVLLEQMAKFGKDIDKWRSHGPRNLERLFDLLNIASPVYRPVFYYFFRDHLIADNLDIATEVANTRPHPKVAVLNGFFADGASGSITGGGNPVRGKIRTNAQGQLQRETYNGPPLQQLTTEYHELQEDAEVVRTELAQVENDVMELQAQVQHREEALRNMEVQIEIDKVEMVKAQKSLEQQRLVVQSRTPDPAVEAEFTRAIADLEKRFEKVDTEYKKFECDLARVDEDIKRITSEETGHSQKKQENARSMLEKLEKAKREKNNKIQSHQHDVERITQNHQKRVDEIKAKTTEAATTEEELFTCTGEIEKAIEERDKNRDLLEDKKNEAKKKSIKVDDIEKKHDAENAKANQYRSAKADQEAALAQFDKRVQKVEKDMGLIKFHEVRTEDFRAKLGPKEYCDEELGQFENLDDEIAQIKIKMNLLKPDLGKLQEYYNVDTRRREIMEEAEQTRKERKLGQMFYMALKNRRFSEFMGALRVIKSIVKTTYRQLTLGGDASLEPVDRFDPFSDGIEFMVKPKAKSWKTIGYLSGGEKTISSLALIFALHYFKPTPFYIMDEIDAALDYRNTSVIAFFLKERAVSAQFIIVSLRNQMFETAYRLIGICKPENRSMAMYIDPQKHVISEQEDDARRRTTGGSIFSQGTQVANGPRQTGGTTFSQQTQTQRESAA